MRRGFVPSVMFVAALFVACGGSSATDLFGASGGSDAGSDASANADGGSNTFDGSTPPDQDAQVPTMDGGGNAKDGSTGGGVCPAPDGMMAGDGGLTCNGVALQGSPLTTNCHNGPAPTAMGGTIRDGLYVLDQLDFYGDPNACPKENERIVWTICGQKWSSVQDFGQGSVYYNVDAMTGAVPGQITLNLKCPSLSTVIDHYDATNNSLTLYISINGGTRLDRFKRQ